MPHLIFLICSTTAAFSVGAQQQPRATVLLRWTPADIQLYARVLRAADQRTLDSTAIGDAFASRLAVLHDVAAQTLAQLAPTHRDVALPWLRTLAGRREVQGTPSTVLAYATFGLGLAHDTASVPLLATLLGRDEITAEAAAWTLGEIGAPARPAISALLGRSRVAGARRRPEVERSLLLAAAKMHPLDFGAVAPYLAASEPSVRWAAAYAVSRQRSPAGARALLYASHPDAAFRSEIARELTAKTVGDSLLVPAIARLSDLIADVDPHVRISAVRSLGTYGTRGRGLMQRSLHDADANVRIAAAQSVASAFLSDSAAWRAEWSADTSFKFRRSLLESATIAGFEFPADSVWRTAPDWRLRAAAVAAWAGSRDTARARSIALTAVHDTDGRVRASAYELLTASDTGRQNASVQAALHAAIADPDTVARLALSAYLRKGSVPAPEPSTVATERPLQWYENVVRRVAIPALEGHPQIARLATGRGDITIRLLGFYTPLTVFNYLTLAQRHFYDGAAFHRVVPAFVAQDGDPRGDGNGGPGYSIRDELNLLGYARGAVGMALSGPDTGGSQYFLTLTPQPHLDGHYTLFGQVVRGLAAMDALVEGDRIDSVHVQW
ncbi:MAG: peptidylprolyl isomerase [Gemmatimonadaceae bacterium]